MCKYGITNVCRYIAFMKTTLRHAVFGALFTFTLAAQAQLTVDDGERRLPLVVDIVRRHR